MIAIKVGKTMGAYSKKTLTCPKCAFPILFWNVAPEVCSRCRTIMPNVTSIMNTIAGRIEYHSCTKEEW